MKSGRKAAHQGCLGFVGGGGVLLEHPWGVTKVGTGPGEYHRVKNMRSVVGLVNLDARIHEKEGRFAGSAHPRPYHDLLRVCGPGNGSPLAICFPRVMRKHANILGVECLLHREELLI